MRPTIPATPSASPVTELQPGMFRRILLSGLIAGILAGLVATAVQYVGLAPLIRSAERREAAAAHATAAEHHGWEPATGLQQTGYSLLANCLAGIGFGLMLSAGLALGGRVDLGRGLLWGMAGYLAWSLAPALGLPPELPGSAAADLGLRQAWWLGTAIATSAGLGLLAFSRPPVLRLGGLALIALPHLIGAPQPASPGGAAPEDLARAFALVSLAMTGLFWLILGGVAAAAYRRLG